MEKDHDKTSHWFDLKDGELIQGLVTIQHDVPRVYVVTTDTPEEYSYIHDRWPRVIQREAWTP
jgi:putative SOS response-associated peptidase YedK